MSAALKLGPTLRILQRRSARPKQTVAMVRPSWLDLRWRGDWWIEGQPPETFVLCVNNQPVAELALSALDVSSANDWLYRLRHRFPRRS